MKNKIGRFREMIQNNRILFAIISLAVIAHISVFITLKTLSIMHPNSLHHTFPMAGGGDDSLEYVDLANDILYNGEFTVPRDINNTPETYRTPGYPFFIAAVKFFTGSLDAVVFFHIILLVICAFLVYAIALIVAPENKTVALIATGLFFFDPAIFFGSQFLATECLYITFFLLSIYLIIKQPQTGYLNYFLAGIAYGISALIRPAGLFMLIPIAIWLALRIFRNRAEWKRIVHCALLFCLAGFLVVFPWYIRNRVVSGVYGLSSLSAYNTLNFNIPLYLSYKSHYSVPMEDIRASLNKKIGMLSNEEQFDIRNTALIKHTIWETIKPDLPSYIFFHISKSVNFFVSPGTKMDAGFVEGFWEGQPTEYWHPETSFVNSILDGRWRDVFKLIGQNILFFPESLFLLLMFVTGLYWYWKERKNSTAVLFFGLVFFLALLTSPISNPRYRVPVIPFMYIAGLSGLALVIKKVKNRKNGSAGNLPSETLNKQ